MCIYRPPNGNYNAFLATMSDILSSFYVKKYHGIFIMGDFNLDLLKYNETNVLEFFNLMFSFSLHPFINKPTRVTSTSASPIDHIWATHLGENIGNYVIDTDVSDHYPTISRFNLEQINQEPQVTYRRAVTKLALENFNSDLDAVNWNNILNSNCCEEAFGLFYEKFNVAFQKSYFK